MKGGSKEENEERRKDVRKDHSEHSAIQASGGLLSTGSDGARGCQ